MTTTGWEVDLWGEMGRDSEIGEWEMAAGVIYRRN